MYLSEDPDMAALREAYDGVHRLWLAAINRELRLREGLEAVIAGGGSSSPGVKGFHAFVDIEVLRGLLSDAD